MKEINILIVRNLGQKIWCLSEYQAHEHFKEISAYKCSHYPLGIMSKVAMHI